MHMYRTSNARSHDIQHHEQTFSIMSSQEAAAALLKTSTHRVAVALPSELTAKHRTHIFSMISNTMTRRWFAEKTARYGGMSVFSGCSVQWYVGLGLTRAVHSNSARPPSLMLTTTPGSCLFRVTKALGISAVNTHAAMHTVQHISRCICKVSRAGSHLPGMQSSIRRTRQERVSNTIKYTCTCTEVPKQTPTCTHNRHWQLSFEVFLK